MKKIFSKMFRKTLLMLSLSLVIAGGVFVFNMQVAKATEGDGTCNAGDATITTPATEAAVGGTSVTVAWDFNGIDCTTTDASVLDVEVSHNGGSSWVKVTTSSNPTSTSATFDSTTGNTPDDSDYQFRLNKGGSIVDTTSYSDVIIDNTAPVILSAETYDNNSANGVIDRIKVTFTESIGMNEDLINKTGWYVTANDTENAYTIDSITWIDSTSMYLNLANEATHTTNKTPQVGYDGSGTTSDLAGNEVTTTSIANATDKAAPFVNLTAPFTTQKVNATKVITFTDSETTDSECSVDAGAHWTNCTTGVTTLGDIAEFAGLAEGAFTLSLRDTDTATNVGGDSEADIIKDTTAPTLDSAVRDTNTQITVTLSELAAEATIDFDNDGGFVVAETGTPATTYAVSAINPGATDDLIVLTVADMGVSAKEGVTVTYSSAGNGAVTDVASNDLATDAVGKTIVAWDTTVPTVTIASSDLADGSYKEGQVIDIDITFSESVISTGDVTVTLSTTDTCTFTVASATTGTCNYTVGAGDTSADLTVTSITGVVNDIAGNTLVVPATPTSNLAANKALVIDTTAPTVNITAPLAAVEVNGADVITFTDDELTDAECSVDNTNWTNCTTNVTTLGDIAEFAGLAEGVFTLYLRDTDLAGNIGTDSEAAIVKDSISPTGYSVSIEQAYINNANKSAASFIFAGAEIGATYNYSINDPETEGNTPAVTGSGTILTATDQITPIDLSGLDDDTLTLSVTLTDPAGNVGTASTDTVVKDVTNPASAVTIANSLYGTTTYVEDTVNGTASDAGSGVASVTITIQESTSNNYWDGDSWEAGVTNLPADGTTTWTYNSATAITHTDTRVYTVTPTATDSAGNSVAGTADTYTWDGTIPTITSYNSDKIDGSYKAGVVIDIDVTFSEAVSTASAITLNLDSGGTCIIAPFSNSATATCNYTVGSGNTSADLTVSNFVAAGAVIDQAGNPMASFVPTGNNLAANKAFIIDTTAPVVNAGTDAGTVSTAFTQDASVIETNMIGITYAWTEQGTSRGTVDFSNTAIQDPSVSVSDASGVEYTIRLTVTDLAGNVGYDETVFIWKSEQLMPILGFSPIDNATGVAIANGTATVTFNEDITLRNEALVILTEDGGSSKKGVVAVDLSNNHILNIPYTGLENSHTYRINILEGAVKSTATGDLNEAGISYFTTVAATGDVTAPTISLTSVNPTQTTEAIIFQSTETGTAYIKYGLSNVYGNTTEISNVTAATPATITLTGLTCGTTYHYKIYAKDASLNESSNLGDATFATSACSDTTAPVITLVHLDRSSYRLGTDTNIVVSVTEDGSATDVTINGTSGAEASNVWTRTFAHGQTEVGTYSFNVVASDVAGNTNTITVLYSIVPADAPATPVVAITSPSAGATLSGDSNTVVFTTNGGASTAAQIQIDGGATWENATSPYSITTTEKANGSHTIRVKDTVGGVTGYSDILVFVASNNSDTTHPTVTNQSPSDGAEILDGDEISVSFSEAMNLETLNSATIKLCDDAEGTVCNTDVDIIWSATDDGKTKAVLIGLGGSGISLDYDVTYYLIVTTGVTDIAGNALETEYVGSFTVGAGPTEPDAGLTVDAMLTNTGVTNGEWNADGSAGDAYEWVFGMTLPNDESLLSIQFANWTNGLNTANNMRYWSEEVEAGELGSATNPVVITSASAYEDDIEITGDAEDWVEGQSGAGIQTKIHVQLQIPGDTPAGSHTTSFRVRTQPSI